ncbi:hypothetical protein P691DRAFT_838216 [Macrolepiota fuliginosa MF-IS2]|uniref:Uncharacterized protein n=1 Tax=Macrolepiota fuliginosa MF-IS2 TaxID=1400762 RepID=A0A9P5X463_9AGAR|nr:hypothetical protein P691DRAFT_838216 [Macrolepiota fuliginosa MF-IS2]
MAELVKQEKRSGWDRRSTTFGRGSRNRYNQLQTLNDCTSPSGNMCGIIGPEAVKLRDCRGNIQTRRQFGMIKIHHKGSQAKGFCGCDLSQGRRCERQMTHEADLNSGRSYSRFMESASSRHVCGHLSTSWYYLGNLNGSRSDDMPFAWYRVELLARQVTMLFHTRCQVLIMELALLLNPEMDASRILQVPGEHNKGHAVSPIVSSSGSSLLLFAQNECADRPVDSYQEYIPRGLRYFVGHPFLPEGRQLPTVYPAVGWVHLVSGSLAPRLFLNSFPNLRLLISKQSSEPGTYDYRLPPESYNLTTGHLPPTRTV